MAKILVIGDDEQARHSLVANLERAGHTAFAARTALEALVRVNEQSFDLVMLDILVPELDAREAITALKKITPKILILSYSGSAWTENIVFLEVADRLGADATIAKPYCSEELLEKVNALLQSVGARHAECG